MSNKPSKAVQTEHISCSCCDIGFGVVDRLCSNASNDNRRIAVLSEQNILLQRRVTGLENLVHGFQRDMVAVKRALGPWFRASEGIGAGAYFSADLPMEIQHSSASTSHTRLLPSTHVETVTPHPSSAHARDHSLLPSSTSPARDSLALYFPPESEEVSTLQQAHRPLAPPMHRHRSSFSSEFHNSSQYDPFTFLSQQAAMQTPLVAPLNLSTTLEGTLHGLRESIAGLAAGVDSTGKRQEMALTHETMRLGEEIGGLRAGVHGLRMQVWNPSSIFVTVFIFWKLC